MGSELVFANLPPSAYNPQTVCLLYYSHIVAVHYADTESLHEFEQSGLSLDGVAGGVERRSESSHAKHAGHNAEHTAAYTALGRQP